MKRVSLLVGIMAALLASCASTEAPVANNNVNIDTASLRSPSSEGCLGIAQQVRILKEQPKGCNLLSDLYVERGNVVSYGDYCKSINYMIADAVAGKGGNVFVLDAVVSDKSERVPNISQDGYSNNGVLMAAYVGRVFNCPEKTKSKKNRENEEDY